MRVLFTFFLLLVNIHGFSQKSEKDLQVNYQLYFDGKSAKVYPAVLYIRDSITVFEKKTSQWQPWDKNQDEKGTHTYVATAKTIEDDFIQINHSGKELLSFEVMPAYKVLITDNYPEMSWAFTTETKSVAGYSCTKATTTYRGRNWVAWFTPDIAVPYGPWKLHGLPGLILEAYSEDQKYTMKAVKVEQAKCDILDKDFSTLIAVKNKKPITYKQFLANQEEYFDNMVKKMNSEGGNAKGVAPPRTGLELKYEWEE